MRHVLASALVVGCAAHRASAPIAQAYEPAPVHVQAPAVPRPVVVQPAPIPTTTCSSAAPNITVVTRNESDLDPDLCTAASGAVTQLPSSILGQTFDVEVTLAYAHVTATRTSCKIRIAVRSAGVDLGDGDGTRVEPTPDDCIALLVEQLLAQTVTTALTGPWQPPAFRSHPPIPPPAPPAPKPTTLDPRAP